MKRRVASLLAATICTVPFLAACGDDEPDTGSGSSDDPVEVHITITHDSVDPNGERIDVERGQTVELHIEAEEAGELHVHSEPEEEIAYDAGTSTHELTIDSPGVVDVEDHHLEMVIVQLEVR